MWKPATRDSNSAFTMRPDLDVPKTMCADAKIAKDVLIIQDVTTKGQTETDVGSNPKIMAGYERAKAESKIDEWRKGRAIGDFHLLRFERSDSVLDGKGVVVKVGHKDRVSMAHEFGTCYSRVILLLS